MASETHPYRLDDNAEVSPHKLTMPGLAPEATIAHETINEENLQLLKDIVCDLLSANLPHNLKINGKNATAYFKKIIEKTRSENTFLFLLYAHTQTSKVACLIDTFKNAQSRKIFMGEFLGAIRRTPAPAIGTEKDLIELFLNHNGIDQLGQKIVNKYNQKLASQPEPEPETEQANTNTTVTQAKESAHARKKLLHLRKRIEQGTGKLSGLFDYITKYNLGSESFGQKIISWAWQKHPQATLNYLENYLLKNGDINARIFTHENLHTRLNEIHARHPEINIPENVALVSFGREPKLPITAISPENLTKLVNLGTHNNTHIDVTVKGFDYLEPIRFALSEHGLIPSESPKKTPTPTSPVEHTPLALSQNDATIDNISAEKRAKIMNFAQQQRDAADNAAQTANSAEIAAPTSLPNTTTTLPPQPPSPKEPSRKPARFGSVAFAAFLGLISVSGKNPQQPTTFSTPIAAASSQPTAPDATNESTDEVIEETQQLALAKTVLKNLLEDFMKNELFSEKTTFQKFTRGYFQIYLANNAKLLKEFIGNLASESKKDPETFSKTFRQAFIKEFLVFAGEDDPELGIKKYEIGKMNEADFENFSRTINSTNN